jgi:hypothetical protein
MVSIFLARRRGAASLSEQSSWFDAASRIAPRLDARRRSSDVDLMISSGCFLSIPLPVTPSFGWRTIARLWIAFRLSIDAEIALTASFEGAAHP